MNKAIIGKKLGMSQVFAADGAVIPVTVIEAGPCPVVHIKTVEKDGYAAAQVAFASISENKVNKPDAGQFKAAGIKPMRYLRELKIDTASLKVGDTINCDVFAAGDRVDVSGVTRGRGFTGVIQRWNAHRVGPMTHGTGPIHRSPGAMAANTYPGRVFKNRKMAGQYGHENVTIQNLTVVKVDAARNLILVKGAVPGPKGSLVTVKETVKRR